MKTHIKDAIRSASAMLALFAYVGIAPAYACTIGEPVRISLPLNGIDVSNADRLRIADAVIEAKKMARRRSSSRRNTRRLYERTERRTAQR